MNFSVLTHEQIRRLRAYGAEAPGSFPVADHAPRLAAPALPRQPTYDAAALAEIADGLAAAGRELSQVNAAFARRRAQATADAARNSLAAEGRAAVDRVRNGPIATMNARAAALHGRKPAGTAPVRSALPAGFTADAGLASPASINARTKEFWASRQ